MKFVFGFVVVAGLAGCGASGDPLRPTGNFGLSIGPDGVTPTASVGAQSGPVSINVGL